MVPFSSHIFVVRVFVSACRGVQAGAAGDARRYPALGIAPGFLLQTALPSKRRATGD